MTNEWLSSSQQDDVNRKTGNSHYALGCKVQLLEVRVHGDFADGVLYRRKIMRLNTVPANFRVAEWESAPDLATCKVLNWEKGYVDG